MKNRSSHKLVFFYCLKGVMAVEQKEYERIAKLEVHLQTMNAAVKRIEEKLDYNQKIICKGLKLMKCSSFVIEKYET